MVQEDVPTEDALAVANQRERRGARMEPEESHSAIIPPESLLRAASAARAAETSAPRKTTPAQYQYTPPEPVAEATAVSKDLPASFTRWVAAAGLLVVAMGGWAWHSATATRSLHVESFPPGAEVRVDGQTLPGHTPLNAEVKASAKEIILDLPFHDRETVALKANENPGKVTLQLRKDFTYVLSEPSNAEVYVDNAPKGQTPLYGLELPGPSRRQELVVKKEGYRPWRVTLENGKRLTSTIRLVPASVSGDSGQ